MKTVKIENQAYQTIMFKPDAIYNAIQSGHREETRTGHSGNEIYVDQAKQSPDE